ncbi:MAG: DUF3157 family protein [Aeromonas sp.]
MLLTRQLPSFIPAAFSCLRARTAVLALCASLVLPVTPAGAQTAPAHGKMAAWPITLTLPDGRDVTLYADQTWQYQVLSQTAGAQPTLTAKALAKPALLAHASREGVSVAPRGVLASAPDSNGELALAFILSNQGSRNVVGVAGTVRFFAPDGAQLSEHPVRLWRAEHRLPETYLRPGQSRPALTLSLPWPVGYAGTPLVQVTLTEVVFR